MERHSRSNVYVPRKISNMLQVLQIKRTLGSCRKLNAVLNKVPLWSADRAPSEAISMLNRLLWSSGSGSPPVNDNVSAFDASVADI